MPSIAVVERRAAEEDKKKEVAYVRAEKAGDDTALAKLSEKYGDGRRNNGDNVRKRVWNCHECNFRNVDTRDVCGKCLAPALAVISLEKQQDASNDLIPARGTLDPTTQINLIGGRAYREFHLPDLDAKKLKAKRDKIAKRAAEDLEARTLVKKNNNNDDDDDDDVHDDEPDCGAGAGPRLGGKAANNRGDDDDEEDEDEETTNYASYDYEREEEEYMMMQEEEDEDGIRYDKNRQLFTMKKDCPSRYWKFIIGSKGKTLQDIQRITGATLILPKEASNNNNNNDNDDNDNNSSSSTIEINGPNKGTILAASLKVDGIIHDNQDRVQYTHFLSIPLSINPSSKAAFASYLQDMTRTCVEEERRIDPFMFQTPSKIHLTLLMLRLHNDEELNKAKSLLAVVQAMVREMFSNPAHAKVSFKGVNYMNDDPSDVHVLYLDLNKDETYKKLVDLIQKINALFIDSGLALAKDVSHNEKLHATVLNSKWRGGDVMDGTLAHFEHKGSSSKNVRISFDATEVLRLFGANGSVLGSHALQRVDLSILGSGVGPDGYYGKVESAYFP